jgi:transcriptional regulator with XRE-family HTH domain
MNVVGTNVARFRRIHGWSQKELARRAGNRNGGYLSQIEAGKVKPGPEYLSRLAEALGVRSSDLEALYE